MSTLAKVQKRSPRSSREHAILISLVETYLKTRKPVGSQTLQNSEMHDLSSATLRNYFVTLEEAGYLKQQHASGGRIPLPKAYAEYARHCYELFLKEKPKKAAKLLNPTDTDIISILEQTAETLSQTIKSAVAITSPRFDHDTVSEIHFVYIDVKRCLCVILTEFGLVRTSLLVPPFTLSHALLRKADRFSRFRLFNEEQEPTIYTDEELSNIRFLYQEATAQYFVRYSGLSEQDLWRTGFSRLTQTQVESVEEISSMVCLLENTNAIRGFSKEAVRSGALHFLVGEDLLPYCPSTPSCSLIAMPYHIGERPVGALVIICPMQVHYLQLFRSLRNTTSELSKLLTNVLIHHKMSYRVAESPASFDYSPHQLAIEFYKNPLLTFTAIQERKND